MVGGVISVTGALAMYRQRVQIELFPSLCTVSLEGRLWRSGTPSADSIIANVPLITQQDGLPKPIWIAHSCSAIFFPHHFAMPKHTHTSITSTDSLLLSLTLPLPTSPISIQTHTLSDPPENLIINAPSDKLSLVEGGNGPRLSCESAGEPQVQFRWLLAKSNAGHDLALASSSPTIRQNTKRSVAISQSSPAAGTSGEPADYAINQVASKAFEFASPSSKGANDVDAAGLAETELIELAGAVSEAGIAPQTSISTLDLSNLSLDRRQSGHYICEASNRLGQARKSVYVNVQCKYLQHNHAVLSPPTSAPLRPLSLDCRRCCFYFKSA